MEPQLFADDLLCHPDGEPQHRLLPALGQVLGALAGVGQDPVPLRQAFGLSFLASLFPDLLALLLGFVNDLPGPLLRERDHIAGSWAASKTSRFSTFGEG